jgi:hypothetical protein
LLQGLAFGVRLSNREISLSPRTLLEYSFVKGVLNPTIN